MTILHIETSTNVCSVAMSKDYDCIFKKSNYDGMNHAALLSLFIQEGLDYLKSENLCLDAVSVSSGPGSYTGLRIGVSTAKGLCYGLDIPLISISTLEVMTLAAKKNVDAATNVLFCPMIDARRMEVYAAIYTSEEQIVREIAPDIINENSYAEFLEINKVFFFGNGAEKCKPILTHPSAAFIENIVPLAENMISLATKAWERKDFVDLAYFEPFYLKEFQTTISKK